MAIKIFDFDKENEELDRRQIRRRLGIEEESDVTPPASFIIPNEQNNPEDTITSVATVENKQVRSQAEEEATALMQKLADQQERLEKYQADVEKAKRIKNSFLNRSKIEEQRRINEQHIAEILREQNELICGGITLTIRTIEFASYLGESLAHMIDDGFRTRDGHFMRLSGQTRELASKLLLQIEGQKSQLKNNETKNKI